MCGGDAVRPTALFLLTTAQMRRLPPHFSLSHGSARVDVGNGSPRAWHIDLEDLRLLAGIRRMAGRNAHRATR